MNLYTLRRAGFLALFMFTGWAVAFSQGTPKERKEWQERRERRGSGLSLFTDQNQVSSGEYMLHIEEAFQKLDSIEGRSELSLEIQVTGKKVAESDSVLQFISKSLSSYSTLSMRNLQMFRILLHNVRHDLDQYSERITTTNDQLLALKTALRGLRRDTLLRQLVRDTVARKPFEVQLKEMRGKWRLTDSLLRNSLTTINQFKTHAASSAITASQAIGTIDNRLEKLGSQIFGKEYNYLWEAGRHNATDVGTELKHSYRAENQALDFYFKDAWGRRFLMWTTGLLFFWWVTWNIRRLKRMGKLDTLKMYDITYLSTQRVMASIVVMLSLAPLFVVNAPAAYVELVQFLLIVVLTLLFRKQWPRELFYYWIGAIIVFILFTLTNHIFSPTILERLCIIVMNVASAAISWFFLAKVPQQIQLRRFIRIVMILNIVLNVLAILCNLYGRFSLSQVFGIAAIFAFTQVVGLSVMVKTIIEALLLQIHTSRVKRGVESRFDYSRIVTDFRMPLLVVVVILWAIVFTTQLSVYTALYDALDALLNAPRNIGSTTFTLSSVFLFFSIIWVAHLLQRYIGYFMGDTGDDEEGESLAYRSKLLMTRLVLLGAGYLLAVAASGLPVDKITIVLGALGVGIGLGLQNIVNNFVSGIILIFDRPLKVGDSIEVGGKAGRVKEIGLRSSTLFTPDGAEVIIPNGDMLSQNIVNWTLSNTFKRIELSLSVTTAESRETVATLVKEAILSADRVLKKREPTVLLTGVNESGFALKVYFWSEDVNKSEQLTSEVRYLIYVSLRDRGIKIV